MNEPAGAARTITSPVPVIGVIYADLELDAGAFRDELEGSQARLDDAYWSRQARRWPFSWQRFTDWWIARRWIVPRDVRKQ